MVSRETDGDGLIGKRATIVGFSTDGSPDHGFVAHVCLDIEDGPRVFFEATNESHEWRIAEEPRAPRVPHDEEA